MEQKKIRSAVIGYGGSFNMGKIHAEQMMEAGMEFIAACDLDPNRMEQAKRDFPNIRTFTKVEDLLALDELDLVTVITPHNTHYSLAMQALEAGKNVITEKPMCITAEEADALVKKAREKDKMLSVYHNRRWDPWYITLKDLIAKDVIGEIFHVEMFMGGYGHPGHTWRSDEKVSGGAQYDWGAHFVDWLLGIMPHKIAALRGAEVKKVWNDITNQDHVETYLFFENGATAQVTISSIARLRKPSTLILGTRGAVIDNLLQGYLIVQTEENGQQVEKQVPYLPGDPGAYYRNVYDHLANGAELIVKPEEARRTIAVLETTSKSARAGRELPVPFES